MGTVGDALDNAVAESFFATLQVELLDRHYWSDRRQLARAMFDYIECFYNPVRRHSYCQMLSPVDHDRTHRLVASPAA
jgi:putative transposase